MDTLLPRSVDCGAVKPHPHAARTLVGGMTEWMKELLGDSDTLSLASFLMSAQAHGIAHSRYTFATTSVPWIPNEEGGRQTHPNAFQPLREQLSQLHPGG